MKFSIFQSTYCPNTTIRVDLKKCLLLSPDFKMKITIKKSNNQKSVYVDVTPIYASTIKSNL